jgi:hypothetical protein
MTDAEWHACTDPQVLLDFLIAQASDRKLRLAGVACCHRIWDLLPEGLWGREAVEVAELFADGAACDERRNAAEQTATDYAEALCENTERWVGWVRLPPKAWAAQAAVNAVDAGGYRSRLACLAAHGAKVRQGNAAGRTERHAQARLLRCIFGNPFRPVAVAPAWVTATVLGLAQAAYEEGRVLPSGQRDRARLAVLADALLDAGCDDEELVAHLRSGGPHVRGCRAVDTILGKT